jgi:glycosyltransferase involved in cell wall biosynthesis
LKKKILLFIKIPPPITGATLMNSYVSASESLNENFDIIKIEVSYAKSVNDLGKLRLNKFIEIFKILIKLVIILVKESPRLIYFQLSPFGMAFLRDLLFILTIKLFGIKIIFHLHGKGIEQKTKKNKIRILYKWVFRNNEIISLSKKLSLDVTNVFNKMPYIVPNGIPIFDIKPNKKSNQIKLLFFSNLFYSKGIIEYLDILKNLKARNLDFKGVIVGNEGDLTECQLNEIIFQKDLSNCVEYLGPKYNDEKVKILYRADILIYLTQNDAFPLVLLESLQYGLPIISTDEGAIPEIINDGVTGFIVEKNKPDKVLEKVLLLIKDTQLRKRMAEAGRKEFNKNYTLEKFEQNILEVFKELCADS